jgi:hypothetical protein
VRREREEKRREEKRRGEEKRREEKRREEVVRYTTFGDTRNCISGFEGSQAVPARPSGKGNAYNRK